MEESSCSFTFYRCLARHVSRFLVDLASVGSQEPVSEGWKLLLGNLHVFVSHSQCLHQHLGSWFEILNRNSGTIFSAGADTLEMRNMELSVFHSGSYLCLRFLGPDKEIILKNPYKMSGHTGVSWFLFSLWGNVEPRRERRVHLEACQLELGPGQWLKYKLGNSPI